MLQACRITKRISTSFSLHGVSLRVEPGEVTGLLGPNGSGKTTLIRVLAGIYQVDSGDIILGGDNIGRNTQSLQRYVGVVTDRLLLYPWLSVKEYLEFCGGLYGMSKSVVMNRALHLMEQLDLNEKIQEPLASLSNGMKQKLNFVRATLHKPKVLLLDEPTLGLDPPSSRVITEYVRDFVRSGGAALLCSHDMTFIARLSDQILLLAKGQVVSQCPLATVPMYCRITISGDPEMIRHQLLAESVSVVRIAPDRYCLEYQAPPNSTLHHNILSLLISTGIWIEHYESDRVSALEQLYEQMCAV